jgi:hypothetical protein
MLVVKEFVSQVFGFGLVVVDFGPARLPIQYDEPDLIYAISRVEMNRSDSHFRRRVAAQLSRRHDGAKAPLAIVFVRAIETVVAVVVRRIVVVVFVEDRPKLPVGRIVPFNIKAR